MGTTSVLQLTGDFTFACWLKTTTTQTRYVAGCYNVSSPFTGWGISILASTGQMRYWSNGTNAWRVATSAYNSGAWVHYCVSITGASGAHYRNGVADGTFAHTAPGSFTGTKRIGALSDGSSAWPGDLAEIGVWNIGFSAAEALSLAHGITPDQVRPASLVWYAPLLGRISPEPDLINAANGSLTGSPTASDHPRTMEAFR
jgi:hypothetical protein